MLENLIIQKYVNEQKSPYEISEDLKSQGINCYPNKVRRLLSKHGYQLRDKSNAQKNALSQGRVDHPTKGKKHSEAVREKISDKVYSLWENMSDEDRAKRCKISKENWLKMTDEERETLRSASARAIREAADEGSKLEKALLFGLRSAGYNVDFHSRNILYTQKLQVDLFLPDLKTAIEIDGLSHFEPIWGEEALVKTRAADNMKNGLLLGRGYFVIRVRTKASNISAAYSRKIVEKVINALDIIKANTALPIEERLIYIDDD